MALREEGSMAMYNVWVVLRKLSLDDKVTRGTLAFFMVWRDGLERYVRDYELK